MKIISIVTISVLLVVLLIRFALPRQVRRQFVDKLKNKKTRLNALETLFRLGSRQDWYNEDEEYASDILSVFCSLGKNVDIYEPSIAGDLAGETTGSKQNLLRTFAELSKVRTNERSPHIRLLFKSVDNLDEVRELPIYQILVELTAKKIVETRVLSEEAEDYFNNTSSSSRESYNKLSVPKKLFARLKNSETYQLYRLHVDKSAESAFAVTDNHAYRLELGKESSNRVARFNFNDRLIASKLQSEFTEAFHKSDKLDLAEAST